MQRLLGMLGKVTGVLTEALLRALLCSSVNCESSAQTDHVRNSSDPPLVKVPTTRLRKIFLSSHVVERGQERGVQPAADVWLPNVSASLWGPGW